MPGDKSISHRALLHAALSPGDSHIRNCLRAGVTEAMIGCLRQLGVAVEEESGALHITGGAWRPPAAPLDCRNSGATIRMLLGALAGQPFTLTLTGTPRLQQRPMGRVARPLRLMGAQIEGDHAPLTVSGGRLRGIEYTSEVASAQVKAAVLLAALQAEGPTTLHQPGPARDHSERMLRALGVNVQSTGHSVTLAPGGALPPTDLTVPGDFSSAAFLMAAAAIVPGSEVRLPAVGLNPTRTGLLDALREMGADISVENRSEVGGEPVGDLVVRHAALRATEIAGERVVRMIDEFPAFAVVATQATGRTVVHDAAELRVKESDRIAAVAAELRRLGATVEEFPDGFAIAGPQQLRGATVDSHGDHRLAMALAVAGLVADPMTVVENAGAVDESFPDFVGVLSSLGAPVVPTFKDPISAAAGMLTSGDSPTKFLLEERARERERDEKKWPPGA